MWRDKEGTQRGENFRHKSKEVLEAQEKFWHIPRIH
jgi:hypothetical protein